jgi:hypothetical protein
VDVVINLREHEAQRTSQHGENGIIAAIFATIGKKNSVCVDVGAFHVSDISNVYELWHDQAWRAVLIEKDHTRAQGLSSHTAAYPYKVSVVNANVGWEGERALDALLDGVGDVPADFDLLNIDVDGPDYHIWRGLRSYRPRVVVIEYNPTIPPHIEVMGIGDNYVGASALALLNLGNELGYTLVACTLTNLFFVLNEEAADFANPNDLPLLFDYSCVTYVMTSYDGGMFFSNLLVSYPFNLESREVRGKIRDEERFHIPAWTPY